MFVSSSRGSKAALEKLLARYLPSRAEGILVWEATCQGQPLHEVQWSSALAAALV